MPNSLLTMVIKSTRKGNWLQEKCPNCGGNLYLYQENGIRSRVKKCLQCSRAFPLEVID